MFSEDIKKQQQHLARTEKLLALEKLKKRKADTRRKIELGGLVIKSGMDGYNKAIVLGALDYALQLMEKEGHYKILFEKRGELMFLVKS